MKHTRQIENALTYIREAQEGLSAMGPGVGVGMTIEALENATRELEAHPTWGMSKDNLDAFTTELINRMGDHERRKIGAAILIADSGGVNDDARMMYNLEKNMCQEYEKLLAQLNSYAFSEALKVGRAS